MTTVNKFIGGVQGHSVGEVYPIIVVGFGDGTWGIQLGRAESSRTSSAKAAHLYAKHVKQILDREGYKQAQEAIRQS